MFEVFGDCPNTGKGVQETVNTKYWRSVFGEKERATLKQRSPFVRGVQRLPEHRESCSRKFEHQVWAFGVREKERPTLIQVQDVRETA